MKQQLIGIRNERVLLAGAAMLAVVASGEAHADVFTMDGTFTAPVSGLFEIVADGAQGGAGFFDAGGMGGEATGEFTLTAGETLNVIVGAMGASSVKTLMGAGTGAEGGGASAVSFGPVGVGLPAVVGGGGGGAGAYSEPGGPGGGSAGLPGSGPGAGTESIAGRGGYSVGNGPGDGGVPGSGGSGGGGGTAVGGVPEYGEGYTNGGGGGGWYSGGTAGLSTFDPGPPGAGLVPGGAGGGVLAGGGGSSYGSGGGGGGFSGGGGGGGAFAVNEPGGGGSSFVNVAGIDTSFAFGVRPGDGFVSITQVTSGVPEPSTWAMMLAGFAGLSFVGWRGKRKTVARAAYTIPH